MKFFVYLVLAGLAPSAFAAPDQIKSDSSSGCTAVFQRDSEREGYKLQLISKDGITRFQSGPIDLVISRKSIIWNSTGDALAFSAGTHFLMSGFIVTSKNGKYTLEKIPNPKGNWDNFHQIPQKWKGSLLTLLVDGPHAGKASDYHFAGTITVDVSSKLKIVSEDINAAEQGAAANP